MEAIPLPNADAESWSEDFAAALRAQRRRTRDFLAAQEERLRRAEADLTTQLQRLGEELAEEHRDNQRNKQELDCHSQTLQQQTAALQELNADFDARQSTWEKLQQDSLAQVQAWEQQLAQSKEEFEHRRDQWEHLVSAEQADLQHQLDQRRQRIEELETELRTVQQQAAKEDAEQERLRARCRRWETEETNFQRQLDERRQQIDELENQLGSARQESKQRTDETEQLRNRCRESEEELTLFRSTAISPSEEERRLQVERDELAARLADAQSQLDYATSKLAAVETNSQAEEENYRRRYEMAMENLKELKAQNIELQQKLVQKSSSSASEEPAPTNGFLDWETEKQRVLAALETDSDEDDAEASQKRLQIEEVLKKTENLLTDKNREINELKELLEKQSENIGSVAVGAAALGEVFDKDALLCEAREDLKQLQEQWREKLRHAEVELSVERAKLARQGQELEERTRFLEQYAPAEFTPGAASKSQKPIRGRWLERLGLKDKEE